VKGCYLLHFDPPYKHARHYIGFAFDIEARFNEHLTGKGANLVAVAVAAGSAVYLARIWPNTFARSARSNQVRNPTLRRAIDVVTAFVVALLLVLAIALLAQEKPRFTGSHHPIAAGGGTMTGAEKGAAKKEEIKNMARFALSTKTGKAEAIEWLERNLELAAGNKPQQDGIAAAIDLIKRGDVA
jgi:hypothetical protein